MPDEAQAREDDLKAGIGVLSALVTGALSLEQLLERVAQSALRAIPHADGVGVSLLHPDDDSHRILALGASDPFVVAIDAIQYELLDEGPCITAVQEAVPVRSGSLSGERRWPRFGPRVGRLGVHSVLSLPLLLPDRRTVGALNAYAHAKNAFDADATRIGELFAAPAGIAVHNAQVLALAQQRVTQLQEALGSRTVIDQAIGILRSRSGDTADEAFARLRAISQGENVKLALLAERIVEEAVRRARARHLDR
ncbi:MAG TPA: GAF and ANTAR domain-containing protein [Jatrophihabitans sp.]|nr:GAF and ANTAR domain-containing protein [Jatrophihabitans sp.]